VTSNKKSFGQGRSATKFSFTYEDYAGLMGLSTEAVRKHAQRGNFDPSDLVSVLEFMQGRLKRRGMSGEIEDLLREARDESGVHDG